MDKLDFNIALDIACRVGKESFADLGGMLATSKFYRNLATDAIVLRQLTLARFSTMLP